MPLIGFFIGKGSGQIDFQRFDGAVREGKRANLYVSELATRALVNYSIRGASRK